MRVDLAVSIPDVTGMDTLEAALAYAEAGFYILPTDPKKDGKHPGSVEGKGWPAKSSRDPKVITAWFAGTGYGIALHCGRSGAVVFDVDRIAQVPKMMRGHLDTAPYQSSRPNDSGRGHYLFLQPPGRMIGNGTGTLGGKWGEIRGRNGVIIAAPSHHTGGGEYRWVRGGPLPVLPDELADLLPDGHDSENTATDAEVQAFIDAHSEATRPGILNGKVKGLAAKIEAGASRHESTIPFLTGALKESCCGYYSAQAAIDAIRPVFINAVTMGENKRTEAEAASEFAGILAWAVAQAKTTDLDPVRARVEEKFPPCGDTTKEPHAGVTFEPNATQATAQPDEASRPAEVHSGQARMAYRVAERYAGKMVHVSGLGWFRWDATRFAPDDRGAAKRAVLAELRRALGESIGDKELRADVRKCESSSGVGGVLDLAAALEPFASVVADLDADPYLLNVANGTLDLRTLELRPHNSADRITKVCRGAYTPDTNSVLWEAFLARILPDEAVRGFVQRLVGVGLLGAVREHVLSIWTGQGANGKSVLDKAIRNALGDYACTAEPDLFMHREGAHPTGEMDLRGVRWVAVSESEKDRRLAEATMKRLTGGDTIRARRMRQDFVEFTPSHTPTLITNHLPRVSGDDPAIWRRIRVVPFDVVIPDAEQDPQLNDRLALEADAILTWAVQGHRDYLNRGLDEPAGVRVATDTYHLNSDAVARFIDECCHTGPAVKSITGQLFDAWDKWRIRDGAEQMSLKAFGLALTGKGFPLPAKTANGQRWRPGISLRADDDGPDGDD